VQGSSGIWSRSKSHEYIRGIDVWEYRLMLVTLLGVEGRLSSSESGIHSSSPSSRLSIVQTASLSSGTQSRASSRESARSAGTGV
jgi:hypothetical protein